MSPATDLQFTFRALGRDGALAVGELTATNREAAQAALAARELYPLALAQRTEEQSEVRGMQGSDLDVGLRLLATLLAARIPVDRALTTFSTVAPRAWHPDALTRVRALVREGRGLSSALRAAPLGIPPLVLGIIEAGELGGNIADAVARASEVAERRASRQRAVRAALAYPTLLAFAGVCSMILLVGVVLPRFAAILLGFGAALPASTRILLAISAVAKASAIPVVFVLLLGVLVVRWRLSTHAPARVAWANLLLRLPLLGRIRLAEGSGRVATAIAALLESAMPLAEALRLAARAAGDPALEVRWREVRTRVLNGERLSAAVGATGAGTPSLPHFVRVGESSGDLARMLAQSARLDSEDADLRVRTLIRVLEPTLILVFGGAVALVSAGLLQAVYGVRPF